MANKLPIFQPSLVYSILKSRTLSQKMSTHVFGVVVAILMLDLLSLSFDSTHTAFMLCVRARVRCAMLCASVLCIHYKMSECSACGCALCAHAYGPRSRSTHSSHARPRAHSHAHAVRSAVVGAMLHHRHHHHHHIIAQRRFVAGCSCTTFLKHD